MTLSNFGKKTTGNLISETIFFEAGIKFVVRINEPQIEIITEDGIDLLLIDNKGVLTRDGVLPPSILYDNSNSGLISTRMQEAIDEIADIASGGGPLQGFILGGNSFGALGVLGTKDSYGLSIKTNDTERIRILPTGEVGLGVSNPTTILDAEGVVTLRGVGTPDVAPLGQARIYYDSVLDLLQISENGNPYVSLGSQGAVFVQGGNAFGEVTILGSNDNYALVFETNNIERARIDTSGNLGIGTIAPGSTLDINGAFSMREMAAPDASPANEGRIYFDSSSKTFKISQNGSDYFDIAISQASFNVGGNAFGIDATLGTVDNYALIFQTNAAEVGRFTTSGYFGLGVNSPGSLLDVNGAITVRQIAEPALSPANEGRIYFDSTSKTFKVSEDGAAYVDMLGGLSLANVFVQNGSAFGETAYLGTYDNFPLVILVNDTEMARFDTTGFIGFGVGVNAPGSMVDINGDLSMRQMAAPDLSPSDQGRIYFDSTSKTFQVSENGGAYVNLLGGGSPNVFLNGGNAFGAATSLGTTDAQAIDILVNNSVVANFGGIVSSNLAVSITYDDYSSGYKGLGKNINASTTSTPLADTNVVSMGVFNSEIHVLGTNSFTDGNAYLNSSTVIAEWGSSGTLPNLIAQQVYADVSGGGQITGINCAISANSIVIDPSTNVALNVGISISTGTGTINTPQPPIFNITSLDHPVHIDVVPPTIVENRGLYIKSPSVTGSGVISGSTAIYIEDQTIVSGATAIKSLGGYNELRTGGTGVIGLQIIGNSGQTADLQEWSIQVEGPDVLAWVSADGSFTTKGNITADIAVGKGNVSVGGFLSVSTRTISDADSPFALDTSSVIFANALEDVVEIDLPLAANFPGRLLYVKKLDDSIHGVNIIANVADLVDGASSFQLLTINTAVLLVSDGVTNWWIIADYSAGVGGPI